MERQHRVRAARPFDFAQGLARRRWHLVPLLLLTSGLAAAAVTIWVAESHGTLKVSGLDGAFLLEIPESPYGSGVVGVDATSGNIWTYGQQRLRAFDREGEEFLDVASSELPDWDPNIDMAVDGDAGRVWLLLGSVVYSYDLQGILQGSFDSGSASERLTLDRSRSILWMGGGAQLRAFNTTLQEVELVDLGSLHVRSIEWDSNRDELWVAAGDRLRRYDADGVQVADMPNPAGSLTSLMSPDGAGGLWIADSTQAWRVDPTGGVSAPFAPFPDSTVPTIISLVASPVDQSLWAANEDHLRHFAVNGAVLQTLELILEDNVQRYVAHLSLFADQTPPTLAILAPHAGSSLRERRPLIDLAYLDPGSGVDASTLEFTLNGSALAVSCESAEDGAECRPTSDLPDGTKNLSVVVSDLEGNGSTPATRTFTIDTVAPEFANLAPAQDAIVAAAAQAITGAVSEPAVVTVNGAPVNLNGVSFSASVVLSEGPNSFDLVATDAAGNAGSVTRRVTLDTVPPAQPVATLIAVGNPVNGVVSVTGGAGAVEAAVGVRIVNVRTGVVVTVQATDNGAFSASIAAIPGDVLQVRAIDAAANSSAHVSVTTGGGGGALDVTLSSPVPGTTASRIAVVTGAVSGSSDAGVAVNGRSVATFADSSVLRFSTAVDLLPGANEIQVIARDPAGNTAMRVVTVARSGEALFDVEVAPASGVAPLNVTFRIRQYSEDGPVRVELDYEGDGSVDRDVPTDELEFAYSYAQAGILSPVVFVTTADGQRRAYSTTVVVESTAQIDAKVQNTWSGFRGALAAGNAVGAASYFSSRARARYATFFNEQQGQLAALGADLPTPQAVEISGTYAEYAMVREIGGVSRLFLVQFVRDADGVWRIAGM